MRNCVLLSCIVLATACAGRPSRATLNPALWSDEDRYAAAMEDACVDYEEDLRDVEALIATSPSSAHAGAEALAAIPFDVLLDAALSRRGLSLQGIHGYDHYHPGFLDAQRALYESRIDAVRSHATDIASRLQEHATLARVAQRDER